MNSTLLQQSYPAPTTLKAAVVIIKLVETRLSVALNWIISFHGELPLTLRKELSRVEAKNGNSQIGTKTRKRSHELPQQFVRTATESGASSYFPDPLFVEDDDLDNETDQGHLSTTRSCHSSQPAPEEAEQIDIKDELVNVLNIQEIIDDSPNFPYLNEVKEEPVSPPPAAAVYECSLCSATFESVPALSVHSMIHATVRIKKMRTRKRKQLVKRKRVARARKTIIEKIKKPTTSKRASPKKKHKVQKESQCELCSRKFDSFHQLTVHFNQTHKSIKPCHLCNISFTRSRERTKHFQAEHPDLCTYSCDQCGRKLLTSISLYRHVRTAHPKQSENIPCEVCGKVFRSAHFLKSHMVSHAAYSFLCQTCGAAFKSEKQLDRHTNLVHATARPHKCPHCSLAFKTTGLLKAHVDRHLGKNVKPCPHCGIVKTSKDLSNHILIVHRGRKFKCAHCPVMFSLRAHLKNHYTLKHPDVTIPLDADLEVIYTKTPEESSASVISPHPSKKTKGPFGPKKFNPSTSLDPLTCATCPRATFHTRDDLNLHMLRHEKDSDYRMVHRVPVQRLHETPSTSAHITERKTEDLPPAQNVVQGPLFQYHQHPSTKEILQQSEAGRRTDMVQEASGRNTVNTAHLGEQSGGIINTPHLCIQTDGRTMDAALFSLLPAWTQNANQAPNGGAYSYNPFQ